MSLFDSPKPPDATKTSQQQLGFNQQAGESQQHLNMVNQNTPYGSLKYSQTGTNADGTPTFTADTTLSPEMKGLFDTQIGTQGTLGKAASDLATNSAPMYAAGPNLDVDTLTKKVMGWGRDYLQPGFDRSRDTLEARLQNQGFARGSEGFTRAQGEATDSENRAYTNLLMQAEPTAFAQEVQKYQLPLQTIQTLMGGAAPQNPSFQATPTAQVGAPNYTGLVANNFQNETAQHNALINGLFGGLGALGGSAMKAFGPTIASGWGSGGGASP